MANVKVRSLKYHTTGALQYPEGVEYEVDETAVDNLTAQGMAIRVDPAPAAQSQAGRGSTAVAPLTTDTFNITPKPQ